MKIHKNLNIIEDFGNFQYQEIVDTMRGYYGNINKLQELDLNIKEFMAITHSFFEIEDYKASIFFGTYFLEQIKDSERNEFKKEIEVILLDLITSYKLLNKPIKYYIYLLQYKFHGLHVHNIEVSISNLEQLFTRNLIIGLNAICFSFISLTYIIQPLYKQTFGYTLFLLLFFCHLGLNAFKKDTLYRFYGCLIRKVFIFLFASKRQL